MRQKGTKEKIRWAASVFIFFSAASAFGANNAYKVVDGPKSFYYGHISYSEVRHDGQDPLVFRQASTTPETAVINLPLGPGDIIRTSELRRCEIQFDNGSIVRLDTDTEFRIETILAPSLSSRQMISNLVLERGQIYVMFKEYDSRELFQVLTPIAAVKLAHNSVAMVRTLPDKTTEVQVEQGEARIMFGSGEKRLEEMKVRKRERWLVTGDNQAEPSEYFTSGDFIAWNNTVNENFDTLHGENFLPQPVERYPLAVRYFAQKYGNPYGEWLWDDLYGYVWRPYYNDVYPSGNWQPYAYGRWTSLNNQLYWVPEEPWGWVPYHLGVWSWDKKKGWFWLPGSAFASAWVNWFAMDDFLGWRPWSLWDWYNDIGFWDASGGYFGSMGGGYAMVAQYQNPAFISYGNSDPGFDLLTKVRKDQLMKKHTNLPMPKEIKDAFKKVVTAMKKGDYAVVDSLRALTGVTRMVKRNDLKGEALREKTIPLDRFAGMMRTLPPWSPLPSPTPVPLIIRKEAMANIDTSTGRGLKREPDLESEKKDVRRGESLKDGGREFAPSLGLTRHFVDPRRLIPGAEAPMRIRDFNPDVRMALGQGVRLTYDSSRNGVIAFGLRLHNAFGPSEGAWQVGRADGSSGDNWSSGSTSGAGSGSAGPGSSSSSAAGSHDGGGRKGGSSDKSIRK